MLNGGVHSKTVKILKRLDQVHIIHKSLKVLKPVPINISSHDLHENGFTGNKALYVTATNRQSVKDITERLILSGLYLLAVKTLCRNFTKSSPRIGQPGGTQFYFLS